MESTITILYHHTQDRVLDSTTFIYARKWASEPDRMYITDIHSGSLETLAPLFKWEELNKVCSKAGF